MNTHFRCPCDNVIRFLVVQITAGKTESTSNSIVFQKRMENNVFVWTLSFKMNARDNSAFYTIQSRFWIHLVNQHLFIDNDSKLLCFSVHFQMIYITLCESCFWVLCVCPGSLWFTPLFKVFWRMFPHKHTLPGICSSSVLKTCYCMVKKP